MLISWTVTTGVGWQGEKCVGNVGSIPRLGFKALCLQDSPLGIRFADYASAFPAGVTVAASWDRQIMRQQGIDMGTEHKLKGIDVQLGPVVGPIGRHPEGGRNWEGYSPGKRCPFADRTTKMLIFLRPKSCRNCCRRDDQGNSGRWCHCLHQALHLERKLSLQEVHNFRIHLTPH